MRSKCWEDRLALVEDKRGGAGDGDCGMLMIRSDRRGESESQGQRSEWVCLSVADP